MFLHLLKEQNKLRFIELCEYAAQADELLEDREKEAISMYCREMGVSDVRQGTKKSLNTLLEELAEEADISEKKIILFEILGLMLADEEYTKQEEEFVHDILIKFGIDKQLFSHMRSLLEIYKTVYGELCLAVCV